jgi:predicted TPR repeat methyltransferase
MSVTLALTDDMDLDSGVDRDPAVDQAAAALEQGRPAEAAALCLATLARGALPLTIAANLVVILRRAGAPEAEGLEADLVACVRAHAARNPDDTAAQFTLGRLLCGLDQAEAAAPILAAALRRDPLNRAGVARLTDILLRRDQADAAVALWQPVFAAEPANGRLPLELAALMAQAGFGDHARRLLDQAEPLCRTNRHQFDFIARTIRGGATTGAQSAMTVEIFDRAAGRYDASIAALDNRGPEMALQVLADLELPRARKLAVLDAGCGTGLCAAGLRPYARLLHGVDLSAGMLNQAHRKRLYDRLTRSDLASIGTLPVGPFDLILSSDVLVYFGDLGPVLANLATLLRPGGWLILTLERAGADGRPWVLDPSGRHRHDPAYVVAALQAAGFAAPRTRIEGELRKDFGQSVPGLALAAQRLALAFGPSGR